MITLKTTKLLSSTLLCFMLVGCFGGNSNNDAQSDDGEIIVKTVYYPNGKIMVESPHKNGLPHGIEKMYDEDGSLFRTSTSVNGVLDGVVRTYFKSGELRSETDWKNGKAHGMMTYYYKDGTVKTASPYVHGSVEGIVRTYYSTGELCTETPYVHTKPKGKGTEYFKDGRVKSERVF